jgi:hypothetical protein
LLVTVSLFTAYAACDGGMGGPFVGIGGEDSLLDQLKAKQGRDQIIANIEFYHELHVKGLVK